MVYYFSEFHKPRFFLFVFFLISRFPFEKIMVCRCQRVVSRDYISYFRELKYTNVSCEEERI